MFVTDDEFPFKGQKPKFTIVCFGLVFSSFRPSTHYLKKFINILIFLIKHKNAYKVYPEITFFRKQDTALE